MIRAGYDVSGAEMLRRCRTSAAGKREKTHNEQSLTAASQKVREILWRLAMRKGEAISFEGKLRDNCGGRQIPVARRLATTTRSGMGLVSRVTPVHTAMRNCTRDEGRPFGFGDQVADPKPPQAAVAKSDGGERCGNVGTRF
jgi:hypothetical protein